MFTISSVPFMEEPVSLHFSVLTAVYLVSEYVDIFEPRCEKTGLRGFRPGPTQTRLYNHRR